MSAVKAVTLVWLVPLLLASCAHTGSVDRLAVSRWARELERHGDPARADRHRARAAELGRRQAPKPD